MNIQKEKPYFEKLFSSPLLRGIARQKTGTPVSVPVFLTVEFVPSDGSDMPHIPGGPAVGGGVEEQRALRLLYHAAVQHQLGGNDAFRIGRWQ